MTVASPDTFALIATERRRLCNELDQLSEADWAAASLCEGWTAHTVAAHLTLSWAGSKLGLVANLVRARGDLGATIDRSSRQLAEQRTPAECVADLRAHAEDRTVPPTMPPEAPLTDVLVHGADLLRPLGRSVAVGPEALATALDFLVGPKAARGFRSASLDGLRLQATDVAWRWSAPDVGDDGGALVSGPALAVAGLLVGRRAYVPDLTGPGVALLVGRL
ncbi:maleylpyruvate isomerase family mycothiol-dependent enzyme [Aquihabitans sp. G128]|uniref:maleylpyruvate isomerase family mycothiol-dependent enzyme n=1 Tax=Aquihabitans sp. G128 TaxID=2849779 RepID=UPI001C2250D6|nr:maleylpyruvate isomerase family mycothiol-dependent enzyme [Aquihabitans sp. G128]QXC61092.1 maleylpyruvate isomerase family mycothiol-dependent enzyme [Aquihabitans sp. G128]